MRRRLKWPLPILVAVLGIGPSLVVVEARQKEPKQKTITISGCLQKGDEANEFAMTEAGGKKYELTSTRVALKDHIGHKVTVTGTLKAGDRDEEAEGWAGQVQVTNLKMISDSCK